MKKNNNTPTLMSERFTRIFALPIIGIGLIVLIGWYCSLMFLTRFSIDEIPMAPSSAYFFIILAAGIGFYTHPQKTALKRNATIVSALIVICLSCLLAITNSYQHYANWEHFLIHMPDTQLSMQLGHMSFVTALLFVITGLAFLFLVSHRKTLKSLSIILTLIVFITSLTLLLGYAFGAPFFYIERFIPPAVLTLLSFLLLSLALIAASDKNTILLKTIWKTSISARLLRGFLPATIAITVIESVFLIRILPLLNIHPAIGVSVVMLIVLAVIVVVVFIISKNMGRALDLALEKVHKSDVRFRAFMDASNAPTFIKDDQFRYLFANEQMARLFNTSTTEIIGKTDTELAESIDILPCQSSDKRALEENEPFTVIEHLGERVFEVTKLPLQLQNNEKGIGAIMKDVTDHIAANEAVKIGEEKYRTMIESSNDIIWMLDHNGNFTFVNTQAEKATGYLLNDIKGKSFQSFVIEDELPFLNDVFVKIMSGETISYEMSLKTAYGNSLILAVNTAPLSTNSEEQAIFSFARDITHQKEAERLLKESEMRFKALHNASFGGVAIHDAGVIKDCNQGFSDITGYSFEELIGMDGLLFVAEDSRPVVVENIKASYEKAYEVVGLRKNGEEYPLRLQGKMIPYEGKMMRVTEFRDITDQKNAKEELRSEQSRLRTLIDNLPDPIYVKDTLGRKVITNPADLKNIGIANELEVLGKTDRDLFLGETGERGFSEDMAVLKTGIPLINKEESFEDSEGLLVWLLTTKVPIYNQKKEIVGLVGIGHDITQRKKTLEELIRTTEKAEESDRLKSAFLANMSHEIRTPMNGILGFAGLLKTPNLSADQQHEYIQIIEKSGERMLNIINDIISISKIESGTTEVDIKESNVNDQIEYVYTFFKPEVDDKGINFSFKNALPLNTSVVDTDKEKLYAILTNLVKNAIKYTLRGAIELGYTHKGDYLEFYVKDTGVGIDDDRQDAVFERFIQADISDTKATQGVGLGLSISKAYVEMLGGNIWVESVKGVGSTFFFTIPYRSEQLTIDEITDAAIDEKVEDQDEGLKILIVEDDETSDLLLSMMLEGISRETLHAKTGLEAIETFRSNTDLDLILMDIKMPGISGYEATREIRQFNTTVPIIAQTAFGLSGDREKALEAGCNDYITKPILIEKLLALIRKIVTTD